MEKIAVLYEHPEWFEPLFRGLETRGIPYEKLHGGRMRFEPADGQDYALLFNRMSPSAGLRGNSQGIFATLHYLAQLERLGVPTINGYPAFALEISKVAQLALFEHLGLRYPRTRIINDPKLALEAAEGLVYPVLVKPNIGGSGAGIRRFDGPAEIAKAIQEGSLHLGQDGLALVQEQMSPQGGHIVRIEVLDGQFLYAIRVYPRLEAGFNLCPADICQEPDAETFPPSPETGVGRSPSEDEIGLCPGESSSKRGLKIEGYHPPGEVIRDVLRIARAGQLDVAGIEYLVSETDGNAYYYDVNALSNFVTDAPAVVGFDPWEPLLDLVAARLRAASTRVPST